MCKRDGTRQTTGTERGPAAPRGEKGVSFAGDGNAVLLAAVRAILVFLTIGGAAAFSSSSALLAESPRPESEFDRKSRGAQLEYLESIVEYYSPAGPEKTDALLGRLILRDDDPEHSAKHVLDHPHRDAEAIARKAIRCPKCRPIVDVVLGIARPPAELREKDSSLSRALRARARELIDDGHGYVKRLAPGDGDLVRARVLLAAAIDDAPADWESLHLYGVVSDLEGRADDAEAAFRKAVNIRPRIGWTYNNLALFYPRDQARGKRAASGRKRSGRGGRADIRRRNPSEPTRRAARRSDSPRSRSRERSGTQRLPARPFTRIRPVNPVVPWTSVPRLRYQVPQWRYVPPYPQWRYVPRYPQWRYVPRYPQFRQFYRFSWRAGVVAPWRCSGW